MEAKGSPYKEMGRQLGHGQAGGILADRLGACNLS